MLTQLTPISEHVTAVLTSHMDSGENFDGAILIGLYPGINAEIWVEAQGIRTNIQCADVDALCKELKRTKTLALQQKSPT